MNHHPEDRASELRALLEDAVSDVDPGHRLSAIRARTDVGSGRRGRARTWLAVGGTGLLAAAAVSAVLFAAGGSSPVAQDPSGPAPMTTTGGLALLTPQVGRGTSHQRAYSTYFVGDTPGGPRLYRDSVYAIYLNSDPVEQISSASSDPDYRTLWPQGSITGVEYGGDEVTVSVTDTAPLDDELALQQLAFTAQGDSRRMVLLHVVADSGARKTVQPDVAALAPVNIVTPFEGTDFRARAGAPHVMHVTGLESAFEGTVPWTVTDAGDRTVRQGFASGTFDPKRLRPWSADVDLSGLPAGSYTFTASDGDPSGDESGKAGKAGSEGNGPTTDTRTFTIE